MKSYVANSIEKILHYAFERQSGNIWETANAGKINKTFWRWRYDNNIAYSRVDTAFNLPYPSTIANVAIGRRP